MIGPLAAIIIIIFLSVLLFKSMDALAFKGKKSKGKLKSYFCGETEGENKKNKGNYGFFFAAFIFTVLHVGILLLATMPHDANIILAACVLLSMTVTSLAVIFGGVSFA